MRTFYGLEELAGAVGEQLGISGWLTIEQERIDAFADATGDHQWIHTDPQRAADGPFGTTIAHGYLTLSLLPALIAEVYTLEDVGARLNYGLGKVRFPAPVPVGARVRAAVELAEASPVGEALQITLRATVEIEGGEKPACVAEMLSRVMPA